jgi:pimeloyl-ACP methyl ester carboxylesterase
MLRIGTGRRSPRLDPAVYLGVPGQRRAIGTIFATSLRELGERYARLPDVLARVRCPTLVAWGDCDPFLPLEQARRTAAAVPGARLAVYEGCGHFVPEERPDELAADVERLIGGDLSLAA